LLALVQSWGGEEGGTNPVSTAQLHTGNHLTADTQVYLSRAIELVMIELEKQLPSVQSKPSDKSPPSAKPKPKPASIPTTPEEILAAEPEISSVGPFASSPCIPFLLSGVHIRLSSPLPAVRRATMKVARVMSRLIGGASNEINFGEDELDVDGKLVTSDANVDDEENEDERPGVKPSTLNPATIISPDHLAAALEGTPRTPLPAYSLSDDTSDLRKVPLPHFLADALELLHKHSESRDHIAAALEALTKLIHRNPPDLTVHCRALMAALVNMGSNVIIETSSTLAKRRMESMVALCSTMRPNDSRTIATSVAYLIDEFYGEHYSLGTKVEMLTVLRKAAEKLSGMGEEGAKLKEGQSAATTSTKTETATVLQRKPLIQPVSPSDTAASHLIPINKPTYSSGSSSQEVSATLAHHQEIIRARVEKRTKRWGMTKKMADQGALTQHASTSTRHYSINLFTHVAHLFFYPLMKRIDTPAAVSMLSQHEYLLLIHLLQTVSIFLPCSSGLSQALPLITRNMCRVLMEYLLMHASAHTAHMHMQRDGKQSSGAAVEQIGVRRMILFALSRILVTYNEKLFADDFPRELPLLVSWLSDTMQSDTDQECRQLGRANLFFVKQLLGDPFESMLNREENRAVAAANRINAALPTLKF